MIKNPEYLLENIPDITVENEEQIVQYFPQYAFYENKGRDRCDCFCTSCRCWHLNEPFRLAHNQIHICNHCGETVKAKALHYGRKKLGRSRKFGFCFAQSGRLYIRFVTVYQRFSEDIYNENPVEMMPQYFFLNEYLYVYEQHAMQRFAYNWYGKTFYPMKTDGIIPSASQSLAWYWGPSEKTLYSGWDSTVLLNLDVIADTDLRYSCADELSDRYTVHEILKWLNLYVRHNNAEYLIKGGFDRIADLLMNGQLKLNKIHWKENNLLKMLGCRKTDIHSFAEYDTNEIELYRNIIKEEPNIQNASGFVSSLSKLGTFAVNEIHDAGVKYRQILKYGKNHQRVMLWKDYLDNCKRLPEGIEELMPAHLEQAHDRAVEKVAYYTNKAEAEMIAKRAKTLKPLLMDTQNLVMLAPETGEEIISEGKILKHCVGGYVNRHARGDTVILFIRHKASPSIPYFTIEVNPKSLTIVQCHGYKNERESNYKKPHEIVEFEQQYTKFLEDIKNVRNNSKRTA